jgi:Tuberculosis necrotizing toxin
VLETVDYGQPWLLGRATSEAEARQLVLNYVSRPLPPIVGVTTFELDQILGSLSPHYVDLRDRVSAAEWPIVIDLPERVPVDRIGALDGIHLYPINTPFEHRSLPPHTLRPETAAHQFLTSRPLRVGSALPSPGSDDPAEGSDSRCRCQGSASAISSSQVFAAHPRQLAQFPSDSGPSFDC